MNPSSSRRKGQVLARRDDTERWLTRRQISDMLALSQSTIVSLETRGLLHSLRVMRLDPAGNLRLTYIYDPDEVAKIPTRQRGVLLLNPGEVEARVYSMLDDGDSVREIVKATSSTSETVHAIRARWLDDGGSDRVIAPPAWAVLESLIGKFDSVTCLVERVDALATAAGVRAIDAIASES